MPVPRYEPMLAANRGDVDGDGWVVEPKLDGWRAMVYVDGGLCVRTRTGRVVTENLPELAPLAELLPDGTVLDGELVAGQGRACDFYRVAGQMSARRRRARLTFAAFDVLHLDGHDVTGLPWSHRRRLLRLLELDGPAWCSLATFDGTVDDVLKACREHGVEGLVAKRTDAPYEPGRRSATWVKVKTAEWREHHAPLRHEG